MTKFITITSGKGGVGKTTVAINLAAALATLGRDVTLVDANLTTPHVSFHLGLKDTSINLHHVLKGENHTHEALSLHPSGMKVLTAAHSRPNQPFYKKRIGNALLDLFGKTEIVVIDSAAGLGQEALSAIDAADETIIVTNPDHASVRDALKTIQVAHDSGSFVLGTIVNRAGRFRSEISSEKIGAFLDSRIISTIAEDNNIRKAELLKHPVVISHPFSSSSRSFNQLADLLNI